MRCFPFICFARFFYIQMRILVPHLRGRTIAVIINILLKQSIKEKYISITEIVMTRVTPRFIHYYNFCGASRLFASLVFYIQMRILVPHLRGRTIAVIINILLKQSIKEKYISITEIVMTRVTPRNIKNIFSTL